MADMSEFEKLAKDAVAEVYKRDPAVGAARVAKEVCAQISHAASANKEPKDAIVAVCRGSMNAVILAGHSVPDAAVALLDELPNTSLIMRAGPEELMSWVMEGIAAVTPMAGAEVRSAISARIEEKFMGASAIFEKFCEDARARG